MNIRSLLLLTPLLLLPLQAQAIPLTYVLTGQFDAIHMDDPDFLDTQPYRLRFGYETLGDPFMQVHPAVLTLHSGVYLGALELEVPTGGTVGDLLRLAGTLIGTGGSANFSGSFQYSDPDLFNLQTFLPPRTPGFGGISVNTVDLAGMVRSGVQEFDLDAPRSLAVIPEPSTLLLVGSVGLLLVLHKRRMALGI